jgi:regulator of sigma E protease
VSHLSQIAQTFGSFILVLGILVFVHEFGHFIVAKAFKIGVPVFSLGFGPRIAGFRRRETDYRVALIPLGGYVKLAGEDGDGEHSGAPEEFASRPRWQRFCVFVAGATFNIVLAFLVMTAIFAIWGKEEVIRPETYPTVADLLPESQAFAAGIRVGDKVLSIGGKDARDLDTQIDEIVLSPDQKKPVELERDGAKTTVQMSTGQDPIYHLGSPGWRLVQIGGGPPRVEMVLGGDPADRAGMKRGDLIVDVDGRVPTGEIEIRAILEKSVGRPVTMTIERAGARQALSITPKDEGGKGKIGVLFADGNRVHRDLTLAQSFGASLDWNLDITRGVFQTLGKLIKREISIRAFSGPIEIARVSREAVRGAQSFLTLLALISLQLGIINLMPVPVLDGGHILILACEGVLRRDLSERVKERVMTAGFVFLLAFFGLVIFYDILKARS